MAEISSNPSYIGLMNQIRGVKRLLEIFPAASEEFKHKLASIEEQLNNLRFVPEKFNRYYSELGWIAYESMNSDLMDAAVKLAEADKCDEGEQALIDYYTNSEAVRYMLVRLRNRPGFKTRYELLSKAYDDFRCERYHSCIPVFLIIIDGVIDEVTKANKGFFASDFNPNLWNSIVGHESGLSKIAKIYAKTRKKVNTEPITLPYRNGILHGKDTNYDNVKVAAKCLAIVFAVGDWEEQYISGKHVKLEPPTPKSLHQQLKEFMESLVAFQRQQEESKNTKNEIFQWEPRQISQEYLDGLHLPNTCISNSPEEKLAEFMRYFSNKNYGMIHDMLARHSAAKSKGQYIQTIKSLIGDFSLIDYKIISITDCSPAISELGVELNITDKSEKSYSLTTKCRMIYQKDAFNTSVLVRCNPQGKWFIIEIYLNEIYHKYREAQISNKREDEG